MWKKLLQVIYCGHIGACSDVLSIVLVLKGTHENILPPWHNITTFNVSMFRKGNDFVFINLID